MPPDEILAIGGKALELDPNLAEAHAARGEALANAAVDATKQLPRSNGRLSSTRKLSMRTSVLCALLRD